MTFWSIRDESEANDFAGTLWKRVVSIRSKRRSACQSTIVAVSVRSQMLYPVELRAPRRAVNLRKKRAAVK
jgi:hypothetical protein